MSRRIMIAGASVAGNTAAWWLGRAGYEVTVVERAPAFRDGGQNVDVRGVGREVMRRMGLEQAALERGTGEEGTAWVEEDGRVAARFLTADTGADGPTAEMEILRGDLARLLYDGARGHASYRFGDSIASVDQNATAATVTFASGVTDRYDAVIVAEGVGSKTRDLIFPGENAPRWMDLTIAYFTIPRAADDDRLWRWFNAPGGRSVSLRPNRHGTTRAMLSVQQPAGGEQDWDVARQKAWLRERFAGAGWQTGRVLDGMADTDDFYFDVLRQVRMPRWSNGRVVLTGDAAWCATPIAGYGTTLAITGAYVLAAELARSADVRAALVGYEQVMRPMVKDAQGVPKLAPRLANPHSRPGIRLLHGVLNVASRPAVRGIAGKLFGGHSRDVDLSRYDRPMPAPAGGRGRFTANPSPLVAIGAVGVALGAIMFVARRRAADPSHRGIDRSGRGGQGNSGR
jgi:2-polyprenyl-6-methoxyphenol hydroxylase-like FAD-dependent oxidoreductase